jgi:carbon monoxide dehydrogenase subunit G
MSTVADEIVINVGIEQVWETIMNPHRLGDWVTIHKSVENVTPPPLRAGATMDQAMSVRGITFRVHWRLAELDPPHLARWEGEGPAHSVALIRYELSADSSGATTFRYSNEFRPPGGRLGSVAGRFIVGATSEREARNSLLRLKSLLEGR